MASAYVIQEQLERAFPALTRPVPVVPTENQIQAGMMALLSCTSSEAESLSATLFDMYAEEVSKIYKAMTSAKP